MRMGFEGPNEIVPTAPTGDSSNRVANTAFVVANTVGSVIASTGLGQTNTTGIVTLFTNLTATSASLGSDVALTNATTYFDGPSIAQGTSGTWLVTGTVTVSDPSTTAQVACKLWDGTTLIASAEARITAGATAISISLSGILASPAANLRMSCKSNSISSAISFNFSGNSKDSTITAARIA